MDGSLFSFCCARGFVNCQTQLCETVTSTRKYGTTGIFIHHVRLLVYCAPRAGWPPDPSNAAILRFLPVAPYTLSGLESFTCLFFWQVVVKCVSRCKDRFGILETSPTRWYNSRVIHCLILSPWTRSFPLVKSHVKMFCSGALTSSTAVSRSLLQMCLAWTRFFLHQTWIRYYWFSYIDLRSWKVF